MFRESKVVASIYNKPSICNKIKDLMESFKKKVGDCVRLLNRGRKDCQARMKEEKENL